MIWDREEYISHMTFAGSKREMFCELFGPLIGLDREWRTQGAGEDELSLEAFGWDSVKYADCRAVIGPVTDIEPVILSETEDEQISIDNMGRHMRMSKKCATIPLPFTYPVEGPDDWTCIKHWYAFDERRLDEDYLSTLGPKREDGTLIMTAMPGGFDELRQLMGEENLCYAFYDEPDMLKDMLDTFADTTIKGLERIAKHTKLDLLRVHEDMAGISGPMIGPGLVREFIVPYYKKVWDAAKSFGATLFSQDSDGNMTSVIDAFLETGLNIMYPAEPKAGMDIKQLREKYGSRMAFMGGIDKFALRGSLEDVRRELEYKLSEPLLGGGCVFALDHRIPNGVPIENYRYYVKLGRELLGLPAATPAKHVRMAL